MQIKEQISQIEKYVTDGKIPAAPGSPQAAEKNGGTISPEEVQKVLLDASIE